MQVEWSHVKTHRRLTARAPTGSAAQLVLGTGQDTGMYSEGADASLVIVLAGSLQVRIEHGVIPLARRQHAVIESGQRFEIAGRGIWLGVLAGGRAWLQSSAHFESPLTFGLLPGLQSICAPMMRTAVAASRAISRMDGAGVESAFSAIARQVAERQSALQEVVARCPGRSWEQRRNTYIRLHRARTAMESSIAADLDLGFFAELASYSPFHFIRAFKAAYGITPYAFLLALRMRRARELLRCSRYAIYEVALMSGFEDRCAFARSFKKHFGESASAIRRRECDEQRKAVA